MDDLDKKLNDVFTGYVVRKDLVKLVKGNAAVPSYVLEFLLGQNCATDDEGHHFRFTVCLTAKLPYRLT